MDELQANSEEMQLEERDKKALTHVQNFMKQSKKFVDPYFRKFNALWAEYFCARNQKNTPNQRANLRLPIAYTVVEKFTPQIVDAFLSEKPYIVAKGRKEEDIHNEDEITEFLTYQIDQMRFFPAFVSFVKTMCILGTAIAKVPWRFEQKLRFKKKPTIDPILGIVTGHTKEPEMETVKNGPNFENVPIQDFFPDWSAVIPGDIESMRGCVHRLWRTMDDLESKAKKKNKDGEDVGIYHNLDKLKQSLDQNKGDNAWSDASDGKSEPDYEAKYRVQGQLPGIKEANKIQLWEYWGYFRDGTDKPWTEYVITVANSDTVIRCDLNPLDGQFKPFIAGVAYIVPNEFYGSGDIEFIMSLIREGVALRNARLDQANMAVNRMWVVDRSAGINIRSIYSRGGGMILTNDVNGIKALEVPEVPGSGYRETAEIGYNIQDAVGQTDASQGASNLGAAYGKTAAGVNFLQSQTSSRVALRVRLLDDMVMRRLGEMMLMHNSQFLSDDAWVRVMNDENPFKKIPLDAFSKEYDFTAGGAVDRLSRHEMQMNYQNNIAPFVKMTEEAQPGTWNFQKIIPEYLKLFDIRDPSKMLNPPEVQQQISQQRQQAEMQMEMAKADQNAKSQAEAQSMLIAQKTRGDAVLQEEKFDHDLSRDALKGLVHVATKSK